MHLNKKIFFKIHGWIGIKLSILFFIVCFSGTLATLSREMDWIFLTESRAVPADSTAALNSIVKNIKKNFPNGEITYWEGGAEPYLCDIIYVQDEGKRYYVYANPYTGKVQGANTLTFQRYFRDLHYFLFIPFQIGHFTVLIFGFLLLISIAAAMVFYNRWYRKFLKFKTGGGPVTFFRSLHRFTGLWSIPFSFLIAVTGIWYFIERTNTAGVRDEANPSYPKIENAAQYDSTANLTYDLDYDRAAALARKAIPGLKVENIVPTNNPGLPLYLNGSDDTPLVRRRANRVYIDPIRYEILEVQKAKELSTVIWLNDIADPLHFGYWGGLTTKIIYFIFGLALSSLILTGLYIAQKRKVKNESERKSKKLGPWRFINWLVSAVMFFFMYYFVIVRYYASWKAVSAITTGWIIFIVLAWYFFDFKLRKKYSAQKTK